MDLLDVLDALGDPVAGQPFICDGADRVLWGRAVDVFALILPFADRRLAPSRSGLGVGGLVWARFKGQAQTSWATLSSFGWPAVSYLLLTIMAVVWLIPDTRIERFYQQRATQGSVK